MRKQVSTIKTLMKYLGARKYWILVSLVLALGSVGLSLYIPVLTGRRSIWRSAGERSTWRASAGFF